MQERRPKSKAGTYDALTIDFADPATPDVMQRNAWHATVALRAGAEVRTSRTLTLRGGAAWGPSPAPADTLGPNAPDASRLSGTLGATYAVTPTVRLDAFGEYLALLARDSANVDALAARYGGSAVLLGVGIRIEPGAR